MIPKYFVAAFALCISYAATAQKPDTTTWPPETYTAIVGERTLIDTELPPLKNTEIAVTARRGAFHSTGKQGQFAYTAPRKGREQVFIYRANGTNSELLKVLGVSALPKDNPIATVPGSQPGEGYATIKLADLLKVSELKYRLPSDSDVTLKGPREIHVALMSEGVLISKPFSQLGAQRLRKLLKTQKPGDYIYLYNLYYYVTGSQMNPCAPILLRLE